MADSLIRCTTASGQSRGFPRSALHARTIQTSPFAFVIGQSDPTFTWTDGPPRLGAVATFSVFERFVVPAPPPWASARLLGALLGAFACACYQPHHFMSSVSLVRRAGYLCKVTTLTHKSSAKWHELFITYT